jgi:uncharacterized repeat protein (TIGR04138 family)
MTEPKGFHQIVEEICARDHRYKADAYEFVIAGLHFTQKRLNRCGHVMGGELLNGIRDYAIDQYGPMAKTVLNHWGIRSTEDFGNIVFLMVENKILSKTDEDTATDFRSVYDFDEAFGNVLRDCVIQDQE